jgi:hypothetical protein
MGLLDDLKPIEKVWSCLVRKMAEELSESDAKILFAAVEDKAFSALGLRKALAQKNLHLHENAIYRHRKQTCACYRVK